MPPPAPRASGNARAADPKDLAEIYTELSDGRIAQIAEMVSPPLTTIHYPIKELVEKAQIPVVTTLLGIGCFPEMHVLSFGWMGMHGMAYANMAVSAADVIIAIGMRFDDRATAKVSAFAPNARIIHIDIDPAEINAIWDKLDSLTPVKAG